jgi:hypothetical protein
MIFFAASYPSSPKVSYTFIKSASSGKFMSSGVGPLQFFFVFAIRVGRHRGIVKIAGPIR